jgi:GNAT superfamily N-acetyltransferase
MTDLEPKRDPLGIVPVFVDRLFHGEGDGTLYCEMVDFEIYRQPNDEGAFVATTLVQGNDYEKIKSRVAKSGELSPEVLSLESKYYGPSRCLGNEILGSFIAHGVDDPEIERPFGGCIVAGEFQSKNARNKVTDHSDREYCLNLSLQTIYVYAEKRGQKLTAALFTRATEWIMDGLYAVQKELGRRDVTVVVDIHIHAGPEMYRGDIFVRRAQSGFVEWRDVFQKDTEGIEWAHLRVGDITSDFDSDPDKTECA